MAGQFTSLGNADSDISEYLKAWIKQDRGGVNTVVCGVIGEGTSKELVSNWESPFDGESLGGHFKKVGGVIEYVTGAGLTSKTTLASRQTWQGNEPHTFNLVLVFYALSNAANEVSAPIAALERMMSPEINAVMPAGRTPLPVTLNIGRNAIMTDCVITNMSVPLDQQKTKDGHLVRAEVNLQIETIEMVNLSAK